MEKEYGTVPCLNIGCPGTHTRGVWRVDSKLMSRDASPGAYPKDSQIQPESLSEGDGDNSPFEKAPL